MVYFRDKCIGCGECVRLCPYGALDDGLLADRRLCESCYQKADAFKCIEKCYPKCRKIAGDEMTVQEVVDIVKRDMAFYQMSGGGVTISGGEPLAQPEFTYALLKSLCANWIDTTIETCGEGNGEDYEAIAPYLKLAFMDLKAFDAAKHVEWTGADNKRILENLERMDKLAGIHGFDLIIRTPVIPGFNDTPEEIGRIAEFVSGNCKNYRGMELLPYHRLGRGKYTSLGLEYALADLEVPSEERMMEFNRILDGFGIPIYRF
jgi:pyruvate formate lyase activating enzyme